MNNPQLVDLNNTPIRVKRDGKVKSAFINDLTYLTDAEIAKLSWGLLLKDTLAHSSHWRRADRQRRWINETAA